MNNVSPNNMIATRSLRWPLVAPLVTVAAVVAAAVLGYVMLIPGCKTVNTPTIQDVGHIAEDCARPAVHNIATHILDDVSSALIMSDFSGGIVSIVANLLKNVAIAEYERAKADAWEAAKCAVVEIKKQTGVHLGYGGMDFDTMARERLMHENASDWLMAH